MNNKAKLIIAALVMVLILTTVLATTVFAAPPYGFDSTGAGTYNGFCPGPGAWAGNTGNGCLGSNQGCGGPYGGPGYTGPTNGSCH